MIAAAAILSVVAVASQAAEAMILSSATEIADMAFYYFASSVVVDYIFWRILPR
jgi:hypothetical protein